MYVHALHAVHALPDLRIVGGRLGDGVSVLMEPSTLLDQQWLAGMRWKKDAVAPRLSRSIR